MVNVTVTARYVYEKPVSGQVYMEASYGQPYMESMEAHYGKNYLDSKQLEDGRCVFHVWLAERPSGLHMFPIKVTVVERNTRLTEYKVDNTATFVNMREHDPQYKELLVANDNRHLEDLADGNDNSSIALELAEKNILTIISKGKILKRGPKSTNLNVWYFDIDIIKSMVPTAKFLVYYLKNNDIVSASINLKVYDACQHKIRTNKREYSLTEKREMEVELSGRAGQHVALLLRDKTFNYMENTPTITKHFVRDEMVLNLVTDGVFNNFRLEIRNRDSLPRKRRNISKEKSLRLRSILGDPPPPPPPPSPTTVPTPLNISADLPIGNITDSRDNSSLSMLNDDSNYHTLMESLSGVFYDVKLRDRNTMKIMVPLPSNVTTWEILSFGVTDDYFCVAESLEIKTYKNFFIKLVFPKFIELFQSFPLKVLLYNYKNNFLKVNLTVHDSPNLCSYKKNVNRFLYQTELEVPPNDSQSVTFVVQAIQSGKFPVKVSANVITGSNLRETVQEKIFVQSGKSEDFLPIDNSPVITGTNYNNSKPSVDDNNNSSNYQTEEIAQDIITAKNSYIFSSIVKSALTEPEKLILTSYGSGEQNIIYMALTIYSLKYIRNTIQMDETVFENGKKFIRMGIEKQLTFRKNDGSFSTLENTESSTWLTAFVLKTFCEALSLEEIDKSIISSAFLWLLKNQKNNGAFKENKLVVYKEMMGIISDAGLTAFVLISFMECKGNCHKEIIDNEAAIIHSIEYLEQQLDKIEDDLTLSIVTYALTLTRSYRSQLAWNKLNKNSQVDTAGKKYWKSSHDDSDSSLSVLVTAYSLLSRSQYDNITQAEPIFHWLMLQDNKNRIFNSTKNTVISLQALAEYSIKSKIPNLDFHVDIFDEFKQQQQQQEETNNILINRSTIFEKPSVSQLPEEDQKSVTSLGLGSQLPFSTEVPVRNKCHFEISSDFEVIRNDMEELQKRCNYSPSQNPRRTNVYCLTIYVRYLKTQPPPLTAVDVDIIKGYYIPQESLHMLSAENLKHVQLNGDSALTLIFDNVANSGIFSLSLPVIHKGEEKLIYRSSIQVYDWNKRNERCTMVYPRDRNTHHLFCNSKRTQCMCTGTCVNCSEVEKLPEMDYYETAACQTNQTVAFIKFLSLDSRLYTARVVKFLKGPVYLKPNSKIFFQRSGCLCGGVSMETEYLIMTNKFFKDESGYKFLVDRGVVVDRFHHIHKIRNTIRNFADKITDIIGFCN
ncbi:CD109 antigen-like [Argonauta hians]